MKLLSSIILVSSWAIAVQAGCNADNCLRAIRGKGDPAASFCNSLTATKVTKTQGLPTYVTQCTGDTLSRASSACSCFMASYTPTAVPTTTPTPPKPTTLACNRDNCFRGMLRADGAAAFCKTYTTKVNTETKGLPTIVSQCSSVPSSISSACSCVMQELTATATATTTPSAPTTTPVTATTKPTTPTQPSGCKPTLVLSGVNEKAFNPANAPFTIKPSCNKLDTKDYTVLLAYEVLGDGPFAGLGKPLAGTMISPDGITLPNGLEYGRQSIIVISTDDHGTPMFQNFQLLFGVITMPVKVLDENDKPVVGLKVTADATAYPGISQVATTDANGVATFVNLPSTSISLFARTEDNRIAFNASDNTKFDKDNGITGWTGGTVKQLPLVKRDTTALEVNTGGQATLVTAHAEPKVYPFTRAVYIKYKFITSEVPGGYFGSNFNDYYSISIRSNQGNLATESQSMNGLGRGAFDSNGATGWLTLQVGVDQGTQWVQFDVGVANVGDSAYDSQVVVAAIGDLTCDQCGDCTKCPGHPVCQPTCQDPPLRSCNFYQRCAEDTLACGPEGYPTKYGTKNCRRFENNLTKFTQKGQDWIWNTMHCLQKALIQPLSQCNMNCDSIRTIAFDSHPTCYLQSGMCDLDVEDWIMIVVTVNSDLIDGNSLDQVLTTAGGCIDHYRAQINQKIDELKQLAIDHVGMAALYLARVVALEAVKAYLQQHFPQNPI
ncbi:hypothetical protein PT974_04486 [Cladobotryum mycophilum]|uniref:Uncharacterized protein n=1 Tax=Cladobotryum mycophilum TaxID=491253 RepID=A0ABR0SVA2_9HYPO